MHLFLSVLNHEVTHAHGILTSLLYGTVTWNSKPSKAFFLQVAFYYGVALHQQKEQLEHMGILEFLFHFVQTSSGSR